MSARLRMRRKARVAAVVTPPIALSGAGAPRMRMGMNVHSATYYSNWRTWRDLGRVGIYGGAWQNGATNAAGWRAQSAGDSSTFTFVQELRFGDAASIDDNYVIWLDAPVGVTMTLAASPGVSNIVQVTPQRITCTIDTAAIRAQLPDVLRNTTSALAGVSVRITVNNTTGAAVTPVPHMARTSQEAGVLTGLRFDDDFITAVTTTSKGPTRPMWAMGGWEGFYGVDANDLPKDSGHSRQDSGYEYVNVGGSDYPNVIKGAAGSKFWSPEDCAEVWHRTQQPMHLTFPAMMSDAAYDAWFARFLAFFTAQSFALPETDLMFEANNEPWNGAGAARTYMARQYGITFRASASGTVSSSFADFLPASRNQAHATYRMILRARAVTALAGRWVALINVQQVNPGNGVAEMMLDHPIPEFGNATVGAQPETRLSSAPYYQAFIGQEQPLANLRTIMRDKWYIDGNVPGGGSAATYWRNQFATQLSSLAQNVTDWNAWCVTKGYPATCRLTNLYEGWTSHDVVQPRNSGLVGTRALYQAMVYQEASNRWMPANATIDGVVETHAAETAASFWEDNDIAFVSRTARGELLRKAYFVKLQNGGLNLFASRAEYASNIAFVPGDPADLVTVFLVNQKRYSALWEFVFRAYMDDPAQTLNNQMRTSLRNAGVTDVALYSLSQYQPIIENWERDQDARTFAVTEYIGRQSQYLTWAQTTAA